MNNAFLVLFLLLCNLLWYVTYLYRCNDFGALRYDTPFHVIAVPLIIVLIALLICGFINGFMAWAVLACGGV